MKYLSTLLLFFALFISGITASAQHKGLPPSFASVTKPEMLYITIIHNHHYRMKPAQADSLVKLNKVKNLKVSTSAEGAAIYGYRAAYGVTVIELVKLTRKEYRWLKLVLEKF